MPEAVWGDWIERFGHGDRRALARVISHVENREAGFRELLGALESARRAFRIGVTGPPGAGKSTLVDRLAKAYAAEGLQVGVIAVDPTSPFTGGALLGDRVRMGDLGTDPRVYIRSMASRGARGGLALATGDVTRVMDAFGFDRLLLETVGVGQVEVEVMHLCDTVVLMFMPESGDGIQTLKAGLIEIAHLFLVNKADRPGAEELAGELDFVLRDRRTARGWSYPVLTLEAVRGKGVEGVLQAVEHHRSYLGSDGRLEGARVRQARVELENALRERLSSYLFEEALPGQELERYARRVADGSLDLYRATDELWGLHFTAPRNDQEQSR